MFQEAYTWLERYSGVSYDFREDISEISSNVIFIDPFEWMTSFNNILENLSNATDIIDEFGDYLPDELPNKSELKKLIVEDVISKLVNVVNNIKRKLNLEITDFGSYDQLVNQSIALNDLVTMIIQNTMEDIIKKDMFEKYEEENDNSWEDMLNIHKNDLSNMHFTVSSIRQDYFDSLDDE
jgi:hypothetical protein